MAVSARPRRPGFTLFELIVVMALLLLLAAIVIPSLGAFRGDTRQRAASDIIRGELAVARARAMEEGKPYRVALSSDGSRIRRAPDGPDFEQMSAFDSPSGSAIAVDYPFDHVTAQVITEQDGMAPTENAGWVTIATVMPDGSCREETSLILITEEGRPGLHVRIRGLTGSSRVVPANGNGAGGMK
jgi:prepilin-type N-terminal cleavage/methylation domain-containing protein